MIHHYYVNPTYYNALKQANVLKDGFLDNLSVSEQVVKKGHSSLYRSYVNGIGNVYIKKYIPKKESGFKISEKVMQLENVEIH